MKISEFVKIVGIVMFDLRFDGYDEGGKKAHCNDPYGE
jgi:hypothetical protein